MSSAIARIVRASSLAALLAAGCGTPVVDAGVSRDAGGDAGAIDDGAIDAAASDAAASDDAGVDVGDSGDPRTDAGTDAGPPPDPCASVTPTCPTASAAEGRGLVAVDRCAFPMEESSAFSSAPALIEALGRITTPVSISHVLSDLNRIGGSSTSVPGSPAGVRIGIHWNDADDATTSWIPQGITGSADSSPTGLVDGRRILLTDWYNDPPSGQPSAGVRVSFVDATNPSAARYRHALLVVPTGTVDAPDFGILDLHAGGITWYGDLLYVAATTGGFRVFDMRHILRVATDRDELGCTGGVCRARLYKYVLPQIGSYVPRGPCPMRFSFTSLDRQSTPPALVSGEYCTDGTCSNPLAGRVYRWPLDPTTSRFMGTRSWPSDAHLMGQRQIQGAAIHDGTYYLSSSAPAGSGGILYRVRVGRAASSRWNTGPESVMVDHDADLLFSQSEYSPRVVFGVALSSYPAP